MLCLDRKGYCGKTPPHHLPFIAVVKLDNVRWVSAFWVMQSLFKFEKKKDENKDTIHLENLEMLTWVD